MDGSLSSTCRWTVALVPFVLACTPPGSAWVGTSDDGALAVSRAYVGESANGESAALYFAVRNDGGDVDALDEVSITGAGWTEIHTTAGQDGMMIMSPVAAMELPAGAVVRLAPGGTHVMLRNLSRLPTAGDTLVGELRFRSGRSVPLTAEVRRLTDLEDILGLPEAAEDLP